MSRVSLIWVTVLLFCCSSQTLFSQKGLIFYPLGALAKPEIENIEYSCDGYSTITLQMPPKSISYYWQTNALGVDMTDASLEKSFTTSQNIYVRAYSDKKWSEATVQYVKVNDIVPVPIVSDNGRCGPGIVTLKASVEKGLDCYWYEKGESKPIVGETISPNLSETTFYNVKAHDNGCFSEGVLVQVTISDPISTKTTVTITCDKTKIVEDEAISLSCSSGSVVEWQCKPPAAIFSPKIWLGDPGNEWFTLITTDNPLSDNPSALGAYEFRAGIQSSRNYCTTYTQSLSLEAIKPQLSVGTTNMVYTNEGGTRSITLSSNLDWSISTKPEWVNSISQTTGSGNSTISLNLAGNATFSEREHAFTVTGKLNGTTRKTITFVVSQEATIPVLSTSKNTIDFDYKVFTTTFNITSNTGWSITSNHPGVSITPTSGSGNASIQLNFPINTSQSAINSSITVSSAQSISDQIISITQDAFPSIEINEKSFAFDGDGNYTGEILPEPPAWFKDEMDAKGKPKWVWFEVDAGCNWHIESKPDWIGILSETSGIEGISEVAFYCFENETVYSREASIVINGTDANGTVIIEDIEIDVAQSGQVPYFDIAESEVLVNSFSGAKSVDVSTNMKIIGIESGGWVKTEVVEKQGDKIIVITYEENRSESKSRQCTITIELEKEGENSFEELIVIQQQKPHIQLSHESLQFNYISFQPQNITLNANCDWEIASVIPDWINDITPVFGTYLESVLDGRGLDDGEQSLIKDPNYATIVLSQGVVNLDFLRTFSIDIECANNYTTQGRTATLTFIGRQNGTIVDEETIAIGQNAHPLYVSTGSTYSVGYTAGTKVISVSSNTSWTVSESSGWLTVSQAYNSGSSGSGIITVNYDLIDQIDENREATITLTPTGGSVRNINFIQKIPTISFSEESVQLTSAADVGKITLLPTTLNWEIDSYPEWITSITPMSGNASGSNQNISITPLQNNSLTSNSGIIKVKGTGDGGVELFSEISITQPVGPPAFSINSEDAQLSSSSTGLNKVIQVNSNVKWEVVENNSWINISNASGKNNGEFVLKVLANNFNTSRSATVTVKCVSEGVSLPNQEINVSQSAAPQCAYISSEALIDFVSGAYIFNRDGDEQLFNIYANSSWTLQLLDGEGNAMDPSTEWVNYSLESGTVGSNAKYKIWCDYSDADGYRNAILRFIAPNGYSNTDLIIAQEGVSGAAGFLNISKTNETIYGESGQFSFTINSNKKWTIETGPGYSIGTDDCTAPWLTLSRTSGIGNCVVQANYDNVPIDFTCSKMITVSYGDVRKVLLVEKVGPILSISEENKNLTFNDANDAFTINVTSNIQWRAETANSWINITNSTGTGDDSFNVSLNNYIAGQGVIELKALNAEGFDDVIINVDVPISISGQILSNIGSGVSSDPYVFEIALESVLNISSNTDWEISCTKSWIEFSYTTGTGSALVGIKLQPFISALPSRSGIIKLIAGSAEYSIYIQQNVDEMRNTLYAISSGNWTDVNTWAFEERGESINAIPNKNTKVFIDGYVVTVNANAESGDINMDDNAGLPTKLLINQNNLKVYGKVKLNNTNQTDLVELKVDENGNLECVEPL